MLTESEPPGSERYGVAEAGGIWPPSIGDIETERLESLRKLSLV